MGPCESVFVAKRRFRCLLCAYPSSICARFDASHSFIHPFIHCIPFGHRHKPELDSTRAPQLVRPRVERQDSPPLSSPPPSRHTTPSFPIPAERLPLTSYPQAGLLSTAAATAALPLFFSAPDAAFDPGRDAPRPGETPPVMRVSQGQALRLARSFQSSMRRTVGRRESARSVVRQGLLCLLLPLCLLCSPCSLLSLRSTHGKSPSRLVPRPTLPRVAARGGTRRY